VRIWIVLDNIVFKPKSEFFARQYLNSLIKRFAFLISIRLSEHIDCSDFGFDLSYQFRCTGIGRVIHHRNHQKIDAVIGSNVLLDEISH